MGSLDNRLERNRKIAPQKKETDWSFLSINDEGAFGQPRNTADRPHFFKPMGTASSVLQQGIDAIRDGRYTDAIPLLEDWCGMTGPHAERYPEAARVLMQAYQETHQIDEAIALCQDLSHHHNEVLKHWAWKLLPTLTKQLPQNGPTTEFVTLPHNEDDHTALQISNKKKLGDTPEQRQILESGLEALAAKKYEKAVARLEDYLQQKKQFDPAKPETHIALARAYQGNRQRQEAIQVCQHLMKVGEKGTRIWAHQYLEAIKQYPRSRDPLATIRSDEEATPEIRWDVTTKATIIALHSSIYVGLLLSPLVPQDLWRNLGLALIHEGTVSADLLLPLAIALLPVSLPIAYFVTTEDKEIRNNAREVANYWITSFCIALIISVVGPMAVMVTEALSKIPLLLNLVRLTLVLAGFSYAVGPLIAIAWTFLKPKRLFRYPFILRLL